MRGFLHFCVSFQSVAPPEPRTFESGLTSSRCAITSAARFHPFSAFTHSKVAGLIRRAGLHYPNADPRRLSEHQILNRWRPFTDQRTTPGTIAAAAKKRAATPAHQTTVNGQVGPLPSKLLTLRPRPCPATNTYARTAKTTIALVILSPMDIVVASLIGSSIPIPGGLIRSGCIDCPAERRKPRPEQSGCFVQRRSRAMLTDRDRQARGLATAAATLRTRSSSPPRPKRRPPGRPRQRGRQAPQRHRALVQHPQAVARTRHPRVSTVGGPFCAREPPGRPGTRVSGRR